MKKTFILIASALLLPLLVGAQELLPFRNPELSREDRIEDLVSRLTLEEKVGMMMHGSKGVERLGIPDYNWWNEALHGIATVFGKETYRDIVVEVMASHEHIVLKRLLILRIFGEYDAPLGHSGVTAIKPCGRNKQMHFKALVSKLEGGGATGKAGTNDKDLGTDTQIIHNTPALRQTAAELDLYNFRILL